MSNAKKFNVRDGQVKDCHKNEDGDWITKRGWIVQSKSGEFAKGCSEYIEPVLEEDLKDG